jgi:hypothetical protein
MFQSTLLGIIFINFVLITNVNNLTLIFWKFEEVDNTINVLFYCVANYFVGFLTEVLCEDLFYRGICAVNVEQINLFVSGYLD